jgi:hypothetical protein
MGSAQNVMGVLQRCDMNYSMINGTASKAIVFEKMLCFTGAATLSIMTLIITTLSITTLSITTLIITAFIITRLSITTFIITTFIITTLSKIGLQTNINGWVI